MNNYFLGVSWSRDPKTGTAKNVEIRGNGTEAEKTTAVGVLAKRVYEDAAERYGKEKARKAVLDAVHIALALADAGI